MFNREQFIKTELDNHYKDALKRFKEKNIVFLGLQGSQNYGLDYEDSDIDTKLIVTPTFKDLAFNKKPVSTTFIREDNSHTDDKDIRLYIEIFRKQNLNFIEILFTPYSIVNPLYEKQWNRLIAANEEIAHYNQFRAVKSMVGVALNKYHSLTHPFPAKVEVLAKYGYDPKQLHHMLRIEEYLQRYIQGESYEACLHSLQKDYLISVKRGCYTLEQAQVCADKCLERIRDLEAIACQIFIDKGNEYVDSLLNDVQGNIMEIALKEELKAKL